MVDKLRKYISTFIIMFWLISTLMAMTTVTDPRVQWQITSISISVYLVLFSLHYYLLYKTYAAFFVLMVFIGELVGTLSGFNLSTNYFPEIMIGLGVLGFISLFKRK